MKKTLLLGASLLCSVFIMATEIPFQKAEIKVYHAKGGGLADCQSTPRS